MEQIFKGIKDFLLNSVNPILDEFEDEEIANLPQFSSKFIVFGAVDITKYSNKIIVSVLPESQEEDEYGNVEYGAQSRFLVTFLVSGDTYENLIRKSCRYAAAFRKSLLTDPNMDGAAEDSEIGERRFYPNAGTDNKQISAVEIDLTILTNTEI